MTEQPERMPNEIWAWEEAGGEQHMQAEPSHWKPLSAPPGSIASQQWPYAALAKLEKEEGK